MPYPLKKIVETIKRGELVVMPTDTIYGVVASALDPAALAKLRRVKQRAPNKPFIILIRARADLAKFKIKLSAAQTKKLKGFWPGPTSVVLGNTAFRLPRPLWLRRLLKQTGPLAAPSANPEGAPPAATTAAAREYFGEQVALYVDGGTVRGRASTLVHLAETGAVRPLRV